MVKKLDIALATTIVALFAATPFKRVLSKDLVTYFDALSKEADERDGDYNLEDCFRVIAETYPVEAPNAQD